MFGKSLKYAMAGAMAAVVFTVLVGGTSLLTENIVVRCLAGLAGICAAYLTYQFSDMLRAIPRAFVATAEATSYQFSEIKAVVAINIAAVKNFLRAPHPFIYSSLALGFGFAYWFVLNFPMLVDPKKDLWFAFAVFWAVGYCVGIVMIAGAALVGQEYFNQGDLAEENLDTGTYSYGTFAKWVAAGVIAFCIYYFWRAAGTFLIAFFKIVHSKERLMVAVDGPLAGLISMGGYAYFASGPVVLLDCLLVMLFAGILGAVFVLVNVKYVAPIFGYNFLPRKI